MWLKVAFEQAELRLTWGNNAGEYPWNYAVNVETLKDATGGVRTALQRVTDWFRGGDPAVLAPVLHGLAEAGAALQFVLFDPRSAGSGAGDVTAEMAALSAWRRWEYERGDTELSIVADPDLHVPWGLVYESDPRAIATDAASLDAFADFWSLRYQLSSTFSGCRYDAHRLSRKREAFRMLSVLNRHEYAHAEATLGDGYRELDEILNLPVGPAFNVTTAERLVDEAVKSDTMFHFFGHGRNGELDLGDRERINVLRFKQMLARLTQRGSASCNVVFLNACDSALGQSDHSLRSATARPGVCGLVATEAEVPRDFAMRFGLRFLRSIVRDGRSIGETMTALRHDAELWPLSLLYGCYAALDFRIAPHQPGATS